MAKQKEEKTLFREQILSKDLEEEVKDSYLSYALSVIIGRAIPDVRDGLKPVQRRILYTMHQLHLHHNQPFKKCARIVGECLGKFHPHGDMAVYDALVRMGQDFSLRYPLIQPQGNFGSIDGDPPAAMRYTESRLSLLSEYMLQDLDKNTVDFVPNFDNTLQEPVILPATLPNLLINGASGIAVGMATSMPPHNLGEVVDAIVYYIDNPLCKIEELLKFIKGPDFPTGGIIYGKKELIDSYKTGKGRIVVRGKAEFEEHKGRVRIVISEIPYQVNKSSLIESIAQLVNKRVIDGISDLRDESDKEGMRVVIELRREASPQVVLNRIYKHTQLETTFSIINLAIVDGRPRILNLKQLISFYVDHRKNVIIRRTQFELEKARHRAHILEGLKKALKFIDKVISIIKKAKDASEAKENLMRQLKLTAIQAQAILEMQLQRLTNLERKKIDEEYLQTIKRIEYLQSILASEKRVLELIKEDLLELKKKFADKRRTQIVAQREEILEEDLIQEEDMVITISGGGYIKRQALSSYREQKRGGRGLVAMQTKEEDFVEHLFIASTKDYLLIFTDRGKIYWLKVYNIPIGTRISRGRNIINLLNLAGTEKITTILSLREIREDVSLILATKKGFVKKISLDKLGKPARKGLIVVSLDKDDALVGAGLSQKKFLVFLATKKGKCICFKESQLRNMSRQARGVRGISLGKDDEVIGMQIIDPSLKDISILTVSSRGFAKRTPLKDYRLQSRSGKGIVNMKVSTRTQEVSGILAVRDEDHVVCITQKGILIRVNVKDIRPTSRSTQGVRIIKVEEDDKVSSVARIILED